MRRRYVVLPLAAVTGNAFDSLDDAERLAGRKVDEDGRPHVIVEVVAEARRRMVPNVEISRLDREEVASV